MSKENDDDITGINPADPKPNGGNKPLPDRKPPAGKPGLLTVEEHRENLDVDAPIFEAVMQSQNWAAGKRILEADFKKAVDAFLKAPMGGIASKGDA